MAGTLSRNATVRDWNDPRGGIWASGWKCSTEKATAHWVVEGGRLGGRGGEREHLPGPRSQAPWQCLPPSLLPHQDTGPRI